MRGVYTWTPNLNLIRKELNIPNDVTLRIYPYDQDIKSGKGLQQGEIIFSCKHFSAIRFPLHPMIHNFFYRLNLTPMQVNPNSLRILSSALVLNIIKGWDLNLSDILYCYKISAIRDEQGFYYLASVSGRAIICGNPTSDKRWKEQPIIVGGNWLAPELNLQPIRTSFGRPVGSFTKLDQKRIQFLQRTVIGNTFNSSTLLKDHYLLEVSRGRIGWEGLNFVSAKQETVVISSESSEATEEYEIKRSTMKKLPAAPLPSLRKSSKRHKILNAEKILQSFESARMDSDNYNPNKQSSPGSKNANSPTSNQPHKYMYVSKEQSDELVDHELPSETDPIMDEAWKPNLIKADGREVSRGDSVEDDPEVCLALASGIWTPTDDLKLMNSPASDFSSKAPVKVMQGLYCTIGLCKKVDAYEMKIKKLESDLAMAEAVAEEADRKRHEAEKSALDKIGDVMQGKEIAETQCVRLLNEIEEMKKTVSQTEAFRKRINHLMKYQEKTYKRFSKQVLQESAKSFRCGWFEALKNDEEKTYSNPDAFDIACGLIPGQYLEDEDVSSPSLSKY